MYVLIFILLILPYLTEVSWSISSKKPYYITAHEEQGKKKVIKITQA